MSHFLKMKVGDKMKMEVGSKLKMKEEKELFTFETYIKERETNMKGKRRKRKTV